MRWHPTDDARDATPFDSQKDARAFVLREGVHQKWPEWVLLTGARALTYVGLRKKGGPFLSLQQGAK